MIGVSMTLLHSLPLILIGLVLCSSGVFVCQSASTSYIQTAAPPGGRASAAGLYVTCYYAGRQHRRRAARGSCGATAAGPPVWRWS